MAIKQVLKGSRTRLERHKKNLEKTLERTRGRVSLSRYWVFRRGINKSALPSAGKATEGTSPVPRPAVYAIRLRVSRRIPALRGRPTPSHAGKGFLTPGPLTKSGEGRYGGGPRVVSR